MNQSTKDELKARPTSEGRRERSVGQVTNSRSRSRRQGGKTSWKPFKRKSVKFEKS